MQKKSDQNMDEKSQIDELGSGVDRKQPDWWNGLWCGQKAARLMKWALVWTESSQIREGKYQN